LQAADVLLYGTTHVPVGEDQAQHLEFARDLAIGFNHTFAPEGTGPLLIPPETILSPAKRVMSLIEPTKKMSKSDPDPRSRILITDSKDEIRKKINGAKTDSFPGISYDRQVRPGVSNLIDILCYMTNDPIISPESIASEMADANMSMKVLKEKVAHAVDEGLRDVRDRYEDVMRLPINELNDVSSLSVAEASRTAEHTMSKIRETLGLQGGFR
jgi:tryptophanyl-tRNA synthetase